MFEDGRDDDEPDAGPLLPPDDRLWRHPSELGSGRDPGPAPSSAATGTPLDDGPARTARAFPWGLSLLSAMAGATAALGVLLIAGGLGSTTVERRVAAPIGDVTTIGALPASVRPGGVAEIADSIAPAIVRIELGDGSVATGVLVDDEGTLLTTAHGIAGQDEVPVVLDGGERVQATVVGTDEWTDVGVLQVDHTGGGAPLGASSLVAVGDTALVMAAPLGSSVAPTVTVGVVRGVQDALVLGEQTLRGLIRADAGLASAASGGALLDQQGQLVGIVTLPPDQEATGTGWAVPLELARQVAADLVEHGRARHVWLGLEGDDVPGGGGVQVQDVSEGSPAADAGIQPDDRIVAMDGVAVATMADLVATLREHDPGDDVQLTYARAGADPTTTQVALAERP